MAISGNLPKHLEVAARTGVLAGQVKDNMPYRMVATEVDLTQKSTTFVDLGGLPVPTNNPAVKDSRIEKSKTVVPQDWYITLSLSQNAIDDDQVGNLESQFRNIMPAFQRHINSRVFTVLDAGDASTYGLGPDGLVLFSNSHLWPGASNTTAQDNLVSSNLTLDTFNTAWVAARQFKDDQGNYWNYNYNLLVVNPYNNVLAANITGNKEAMDTGNREMNPYAGTQYITVPEMGTNAWVLVAANEDTKPLFVAIRKRPTLHNVWFNSEQPDGGMHYFQYHGRYSVEYADWPTAIMGQT